MSFLHELNPRQQEAVKAVEGPVMVIAGPGSGKTRVLTYRIAHLISIGVPAYQILALTFTNKAASEMKERIIRLVGDKSRQLWMGTFHSIFARILRVECEKLGFGKNFSIYDTSDTLGLIKNIMSSKGLSVQQFNPNAVRARISAAKNQLVAPEEYTRRAIDLFEEKTAGVYMEYQRKLRQNNAMDFDDLLLKPIDLFAHHKRVLEQYQDRFRFSLIDEYQDTNHAQYVLIRYLGEKYKNICVVGDDAQSIYAFRGADIRNMLDFERDYPTAKIIRLEQNYRSTRTILNAADQVIKKNIDQISKDLWTENLDGEMIDVLARDDDRDEGSSIVSAIFEESHSRKLDFKDFAIMYRTNAQSRSLEDALRRQNIPYLIVGGIEFYQRKEVKDLLAYLRLLVNPRDNENFLRIVNTPNRGLGDVAIKHLEKHAKGLDVSLLDASLQAHQIPGLTARARAAFTNFSVTIAKYRNLQSEVSMSELTRAFVDELGILQLYKEEGTAESMARWENVQELLSAITEFAAQREDPSLENFLQEVSLVSDLDQWDDKHNAVTLMTLHSAKGLEFPVVFITGMEEGLLPFYNGTIERKEIEEERRLFYVGVTRAMKKLYLTHARIRFRFGEMTYQSPSRFLEEIDKTLLSVTGNSFMASRPQSSRSAPVRSPARKHADPDPLFHADQQPDYDTESTSARDFHTGTLVEHDVFGRGKVLNILGQGDALKAVVDFPGIGRKNLLLRYARLKIL